MKKPNKPTLSIKEITKIKKIKTIKESASIAQLRRGFTASAFVKRTVIEPNGSDITFINGCGAHCDTIAEVENLYQKLTDFEELITDCPQGSNDGEYADDYGDRADESEFIKNAGAFIKRRV